MFSRGRGLGAYAVSVFPKRNVTAIAIIIIIISSSSSSSITISSSIVVKVVLY